MRRKISTEVTLETIADRDDTHPFMLSSTLNGKTPTVICFTYKEAKELLKALTGHIDCLSRVYANSDRRTTSERATTKEE